MKIRLVGGPFAGKVMEGDGRNTVVLTGPKRMTRRQQWEYFRDNPPVNYLSTRGVLPTVEARYQIAMRVQGVGTQLFKAPCMHPDGSIFYEYVKDSKREWR